MKTKYLWIGMVALILVAAIAVATRYGVLSEEDQNLQPLLTELEREKLNIERTIAGLHSGLTQVQQDRAEIETRITDLQSDLTWALRDRTGLEERINSLQKELTQFRQDRTGLEEKITSLERDLIQAQQGRASLLEGRVSELERDFSQAEQDRRVLDEMITGLERDLVQARQDRTDVGDRITGLEQDLAQAQQDRTKLAKTTSDLERDLARSQARISLIERAMAKVRETPGIFDEVMNIPDLERDVEAIMRRLNSVEGYALTHEHPFAEFAFGGNVMAGTIDGLTGHRRHGDVSTLHGKDTNIGGRPSHAGMKGWFFPRRFPASDTGRHSTIQPQWNSAWHHRYAHPGIYEAFQDGMKIMVVFLHESEVLCELVGEKYNTGGRSYPCPRGDDWDSLVRQIDEAKDWARRTEWAEIAYSADEARAIINDGKLAVVLGVESDYTFGNENSAFDPVDRLNEYYAQGVRSFYLAHFVNSRLAGAAITPHGRAMQYIHNSIYLGLSPICVKGFVWDRFTGCQQKLRHVSEFGLVEYLIATPTFAMSEGRANNPDGSRIWHNHLGLTEAGKRVMQEAMKKGMLIDIGHVSDRTQEDMWEISQAHDGYPLNALHAWPRSRMREEAVEFDTAQGRFSRVLVPTEWHLSDRALEMIKATGGIYGQRLGSERVTRYEASGVPWPGGCAQGTTISAAHLLAWLLDQGLNVAYSLDFHPADGLRPRGRSIPRPVAPDNVGAYSCGPETSSREIVCTFREVEGPRNGEGVHLEECVDRPTHWPGYEFFTAGLIHIGKMADFHRDLVDVGFRTRYLDELKNKSAEKFLQMWEKSEDIAKRLNREQGPSTLPPPLPPEEPTGDRRLP
jgi:predicted  nucleic acid-binding Zn-ribbon protein